MLALLANAWTTFSLGALVAGLGGVGLIVVVLLGLTSLPAFLRRPLIAAGVVLLAGAAVWQAGQAKGAHDAFALTAARIHAAEIRRADAAEKALAADRARASSDATTIADLRRQIDETPDDPRPGLDRAAARRLRRVQ